MKLLYLKLSCLLFFLILIDFLQPFYFTLRLEFLYVGLLFVSFHAPLGFAVVCMLAAGIVKDILLFSFFPFYTVFFLASCVFIKYFLRHFHPRPIAQTLSVAAILMLYGLYNAMLVRQVDIKLLILFTVQSVVLYHLYQYLIIRWMPDLLET